MQTLLNTLALVAASASLASAQSHWKQIGKTSSGNSVFVDPASLKTVNGITTARLRVKFAPPVKVPEGAWYASHYIAMFDCAKSTIASKETVYYGNESETKVVERHTNAKPGYGPALGSVTQIALDYICKKG